MTKSEPIPEAEELFESDSAEAITEYLNLMEETESPRSYLIWSLIGAAAGLVGRNAKLDLGLLNITANLFVVLIGPSGVKKSTAIGYLSRLLEGTSLNFGPSDTGGQRHGLMAALGGFHRNHMHQTLLSGLPVTASMTQPRKPTDMMLMVSELGRLMGQSNREMADFFVDLYDGTTVDYQTKAGETLLRKPLVSLIGGVTPSSLASILPENAATHGIISRIIFVYDDQIHKQVPLPPMPSEDWYVAEEKLRKRLRWIDENRMDFSLDDSAKQAYTILYPYRADLLDPRLESYQARRSNHLLKVAICLAALRNSIRIKESDVLLAHELLMLIEPQMRRALEYFGKSKAYIGRMLILNFLRNSPDKSGSHQELLAAAVSELTPKEADDAINGLLQAKEIIQWGAARYVLNDMANRTIESNLKK